MNHLTTAQLHTVVFFCRVSKMVMVCGSYLPNGGTYDATVKITENMKSWRCSLNQTTNLTESYALKKLGSKLPQFWSFLDRSGRYFHDFDRFSPFERKVQVIIWRNSLHQVATAIDVRRELNEMEIFRSSRFSRFCRGGGGCFRAKHQTTANLGAVDVFQAVRSRMQGNAPTEER